MNKILRYSFVALLAMIVGNVMATDVTDELTRATFGVTGSNYSDVTGKKATSTAVYAANMAGGNDAIQLRSKNNNSGIISTTSGGRIKSVKIEWNSNTLGDRVLDIYGNTDAYEAPTDLYDTSKQGTKIASFTCSNGTKTTTIEGDYQYIGIRSNKDAMYIDKITIVWEAASSAENANLSFSPEILTVRLGKPFTAPTLTNEHSVAVVYSSSNTDVADVNAETGAVTLKAAGEATITAAVPESNTSYYGSASYTLIVEELATVNTFPFSETFANTFGKFLVEDKSLAEGLSFVWAKNSGYVKASGFANSAAHAAESWLVSPLFDLTNASAPNMMFEHAINKFASVDAAKQDASVWVREGDEGEWTKLEIEYPEELSWTFVSSGSIDLSAYIGKTIQIGFKYLSTNESAGTWEIKNFKVIDGQDAGLAFSKDKVSIVLGTENPEYPTLTNPHELTVVYSSSNTDVAEINAETGAITLKADGKTTIKATFAGNDEYLAGEASYELTVIDDNVKGRKGNPYTIAEIQAIEETAYPTDKVWVVGYIAGCAATGGVISKDDPVNSNILLTATGTFDETDVLLPVAIPNNATRTAVNIVDNPTNVGKEVKLYGKVQKYFGVTGVKEVTSHEFTGNSVDIVVTGINNVNADKAENGVMYNLAGQKVNNGYKGVVIMNGKKMLNK